MEEEDASERRGHHTATVCGAAAMAMAVMREGTAPKEGERKERIAKQE